MEISKGIMAKVYEDLAKEAGLTVEQYRAKMAEEFVKFWCQCGNPSGEVTFHDDGVMPSAACCQKHHYHCDDCGKVTQVG